MVIVVDRTAQQHSARCNAALVRLEHRDSIGEAHAEDRGWTVPVRFPYRALSVAVNRHVDADQLRPVPLLLAREPEVLALAEYLHVDRVPTLAVVILDLHVQRRRLFSHDALGGGNNGTIFPVS